ncbi:uroporphyrinogen-III C-methyltransferase [Aureibacter tunicatorum]|uniref:uroporphyrinogen-III C-methyltransferase n=1 Tax=Aureibacter tunicatorum TaxID=866807 RepID=A0AAE4BUB7_9BACT|nr:uroporphyrinogen-III C-methyltransferase [Aureibacter tunicatorum]MDR6241631.1 uroporphyrin-III C-methyltransferase [Aureibacter tunicatorum]BDD07253.1 uroporphyrinogen-III C-methyltransferase [Aureibacter tunicatorum]
MQKGKLTLVGAGPGDPDLITLKAIKALERADVILYDALVNPDLLHYAKDGAKHVFVGKRCGKHSVPQEEINELIVKYALEGNDVVRLKCGDPFIFARGKEEIEYAENFGIKSEIVVGISSINLLGHYNIPITRRGINESFWVITAVTKEKKLSKDLDLAAQSNATCIILMGLRRIEEILAKFNEAGKANVSAAVISKGSHDDGKLLLGNVGNLAEKVESSDVKAPAIIVVGDVVSTHPDFAKLMKEEGYL